MANVNDYFEKAFDDFKDNLVDDLIKLGERAVQDCRNRGAYQDNTGHLRNSNSYEVTSIGDDTEFTLKNTAEYASFVEAKGYNVIAMTTLMIENELQ